MPVRPELGRQRQKDNEFKVKLGYTVSSWHVCLIWKIVRCRV